MIYDHLIISGLLGPSYDFDYLSILCMFDNCCDHYSDSYRFGYFLMFFHYISIKSSLFLVTLLSFEMKSLASFPQ